MKGFENMTVRFFAYSEEIQDIEEVEEVEFNNTEGEISYDRHTIFANGVKQVCLTKMPF